MVRTPHFVYHQSMDVTGFDLRAADIANAIGEPARARMLYALSDGRARTSTELAALAEVTPSTASVHLKRLCERKLLRVVAQGKHRYFSLYRAEVANALEALSVLAGARAEFVPNTPRGLRAARSCYDHIAGSLGVKLHDRFRTLRWITGETDYELTAAGSQSLSALGVDVDATRAHRRRFAYACVDWSERRPHLAGALGAAVLDLALKRKWVCRDLEGRALNLTQVGRRELSSRFELEL
jgi:DNA-binding transcriptional ArsR family regulator